MHSSNSIDLSKPLTLYSLKKMYADGEKIAMLTCYDASFASAMDQAGVDVLLVGDSLGMVIQGHQDTLPVTIEDMAYHTQAVARTTKRAWVIADMPFGSYTSETEAFSNAKALMQAGAKMVKLEGGEWLLPIVSFLTTRGIPVCAHLGLTPQSVHQIGGYRIQGKSETAHQALINDAQGLADAGASMLVLELMPSSVATAVTETIDIPTIGIGAGANTDGQVLVNYDMLDIFPGKKARFVKNYMAENNSIQAALEAYVADVKSGLFPTDAHAY